MNRPGQERNNGKPGFGICSHCKKWETITDGHYLCRVCEGYEHPLSESLQVTQEHRTQPLTPEELEALADDVRLLYADGGHKTEVYPATTAAQLLATIAERDARFEAVLSVVVNSPHGTLHCDLVAKVITAAKGEKA